MKKSLLTSVLVACFGLANAQTEQGGWFVGASSALSFTSTSYDGQADKDTNFNLEGRAGSFIADNLNLGLFIGFDASKDGGTDIKTTASSIGPYIRYYANGQFYFGVGYAVSNAKVTSGGTTLGEISGGLIGMEAGYPIWINDNVAVEPALNYQLGTGDFDSSRSLSLAVGFGIYF